LVERLCAVEPLPDDRAGFLLGRLYTGLLSEEKRKNLGAYYTPPALALRLIIIDPACGGASFLAAVAKKMLECARGARASHSLRQIEERLAGIELDPFAAWLSMAILDLELLPVAMREGRPVRNLVRVADALTGTETNEYDPSSEIPSDGCKSLFAMLYTGAVDGSGRCCVPAK
jgi:adenine-specific DNA-methyltransferase